MRQQTRNSGRQNTRGRNGTRDGDRRSELVAVAARLFRERGYDATTTSEIAQEMNIRKASLYHYVRTKEDLLWMVVQGPLRELVANAAEILSPASNASAAEKLAEAMAAHTRSYEAYYPHMFVLTQENGKRLSPARRREFGALRDRYSALWVRALEDGVAAGELRSDLDSKLTVHAIFGMLNWMFRWFTPGKGYASEQVAANFAEILEGGIKRCRDDGA